MLLNAFCKRFSVSQICFHWTITNFNFGNHHHNSILIFVDDGSYLQVFRLQLLREKKKEMESPTKRNIRYLVPKRGCDMERGKNAKKKLYDDPTEARSQDLQCVRLT